MITRTLNDLYPNGIVSGIFSDLQSLPVPWKDLGIQNKLDIAYHGNNGNRLISPMLDVLEKNNPISALHRSDVANILWSLYGERWKHLYDTLFFDYNPIENYRMVEEENGTESGTTSGTSADTITNSGNVTTLQTLNTQDEDTVNKTRTDDMSDARDNMVHGFNSSAGVMSDSSTTDSDGTHTETGTDTMKHTGTINTVNTDATSMTDNGTTSGSHSDENHRTLTRSGNIGVTTSQQMIESERMLWDFNYFHKVFDDINKTLTLLIY